MLDLNELDKFFTWRINIRVLKNQTTELYSDKLLHCTQEMYEKTGLKLDTYSKVIEKRVCPDGEKLKNIWKIRNGYSNKLDRISFNIQAVLCTNPPDNPNYCASDDDI